MKDIRVMSLNEDGVTSLRLTPVFSYVWNDEAIIQRFIKELKSSSLWPLVEYPSSASNIDVSMAINDANTKMKEYFPSRAIRGKLKKLDKSKKNTKNAIDIELSIDDRIINMEV